MAHVRILLAPFFLLVMLTGCDKPSAPPAPKLDSNQTSVPETKMPAPGNAQPNMQSPSSVQR